MCICIAHNNRMHVHLHAHIHTVLHLFTHIALCINMALYVLFIYFYYCVRNTNALVCVYAHASVHVQICYANLYTAFTICQANIAQENRPFSSMTY